MSEELPNNNESQRDSRLVKFLRRASAIIAAEKGLNNVAKAKLDELASHLHLPDELFDEGLAQLQASSSPVGALTDYEQDFLKFLEHEFSQKRIGSVLSISIEEKAIEHARRRYGIDPHRAGRLIDFQADKSGIGRLSRTDAREFGRRMILEIVGEQLSLDEESEKKVHRIGRRWGCNPDEVEELVTKQITQNELDLKRARRRPLIRGAATLIALALAGLGGKWVYDNYDSLFANPVVKIQPEPKLPQPNLVEAKSELELAFPDLATAIAADNPVTRGDAMWSATEGVLNSSAQNDQQRMALVSWFLKEPVNSVANRFSQSIEKALSAEPKSSRNGALEVPYRAAALALQAVELSGHLESRRKSLLNLLRTKTGLKLSDPSSADTAAIETAIATSQWNRLIESSYRSPGRSSILVEPLLDLTENKLPPSQLQQIASRSIRTIALADKTQWQNMRDPILAVILTADEVQRIEWIDLWLDHYDGSVGFRDFTGKILVTQSNKQPKPAARDYASFLLSERSDWRNRKFKFALLRQQKIRSRFDQLRPFMKSTADTKVNPDLIFQTALTANLCLEAMAIMDSGRGGDDSAWNEVDARLEQYDSRLREFVFLDEQGGANQRPSTAGFDTTLRDRTISTFGDLSKANQAKRIAAIDRLPGLAAKFPSVPQAMASTLATYVLSTQSSDEWIQLQRVLPDLLQWPRVVLAIADQLPNSTATEKQLRTLYTVLAGKPWESSNGALSKEAMSLSLLQLTSEVLLARTKVDPNSTDSDWLRLEKFLQTAYWQRARILGNVGSLPNRSVLENAEQCLIATTKNVPATERAVTMLQSGAGNDLERVVLLNQMLAGMPESKSSANLGARLLKSELKLLQIWNRQREEQLKGLIDGF